MGNRLGVDVCGSLVRVTATLAERSTLPLDALLEGDPVEGPTPGERRWSPMASPNDRQEGTAVWRTEDILLDFLARAPVWGDPWIFNYDTKDGRKHKRVYCFLFDLSEGQSILNWTFSSMLRLKEAYDFRSAGADPQCAPPSFQVWLTGSGAGAFVNTAQASLKMFNLSGGHDLRIETHIVRELQCVVRALDFLVREMPESLFRYERTVNGVCDSAPVPPGNVFKPVVLDRKDTENFCPYLLVNLKAGVSFHKVTSNTQSTRVGGSPIGCATFVGLTKLLCGSDTTPFDAFLFAQQGDQRRVDMLVSDIYGGDCVSVGLSGSLVASTLGKMQHLKPSEVKCDTTYQVEEPSRRNAGNASIELNGPHLTAFHQTNRPDHAQNGADQVAATLCLRGVRCRDILAADSERLAGLENCMVNHKSESGSCKRIGPSLDTHEMRMCQLDTTDMPSQADLAKSLLSMTSFNVAQLAYFNAKLHNCHRIVFIGYYLEMPDYLASIQHCVDFWSEGDCSVHFVRVAPFLGAFGATLEPRTSAV